jgi:hypothetical protein
LKSAPRADFREWASFMSERERLRLRMVENTAEINRLHGRIHETFRKREDGESFRKEWSDACEEFHERYGQLCLPGGWDAGFKERLKSGDTGTVEVALCFLEVRPFFFRSGYMWKDLLQKCKGIPMSTEQAERFSTLLKKFEEYKLARDHKARRGAKVRNDLSGLLRQFDRQFPIVFQDTDLDGIETVGKLFEIICPKLRLEAISMPERSHGKAREPFSPERKRGIRSLAVFLSETHNRGTWNAPDVWATLVACVRAAYGLDDSTPIGPNTEFRELKRK